MKLFYLTKFFSELGFLNPVWLILKRLHIDYEPAVLLLDTHSKESKPGVQTSVRTCVFSAVLFSFQKPETAVDG